MSTEKFDNDTFFNDLRKKEYARLDASGQVYLDYTGGNLYPKSLLDTHYQYLQNAVYGNPHSSNPTSLLSEKFVNEARQKVLDFFNAGDYYCIFTPNATGAIKIVGECYPFAADTHFLGTADNHNSVNGIREYCLNKGGSYSYCSMDLTDFSIDDSELSEQLGRYPDKKNRMFAFPAQSNVTGVQHSLEWIQKAHKHGWDVLLDAAAFVPTSKLDLFIVRPDFVALSFYKIFGYPTGIGCLLVKKSKFNLLQKPWFSGGTVILSSVAHGGHFLKTDHERFENGTIDYLDIPAIANGLDFMSAITMDRITERIRSLSQLVLLGLQELRHDNGRPLVKLYGPNHVGNRGGTFLLNFFDVDGDLYPFQHIEQWANAEKISLRTGCFCNPGIDELNHGLPSEGLKNYFTSRETGDYDDMVRFLGKARGAVRLSIGFPTLPSDIEKFMGFAKKLVSRTVLGKEVLVSDQVSNN
ncbi:aminotransferase class V-fold PLP-dependent enzyme [Pricia sp.]|uniref:aminotransferase class V-fold PLP-dependent enzyme n=1 Tax=Pricia sp. TaxID=2268138 RepID=UPI0035935603